MLWGFVHVILRMQFLLKEMSQTHHICLLHQQFHLCPEKFFFFDVNK